MQPNKSLTAERIIAILIMALGGAGLARYSAATADSSLPVAIAGVLGITGLAVGLSVLGSALAAVRSRRQLAA